MLTALLLTVPASCLAVATAASPTPIPVTLKFPTGILHGTPERPAGKDLTATAEAFVQDMAKGDFTAAEADFTAQMQQAAPADKLQGIWQALVLQGGAYQKIAGTKTVNQGGYASVIVNTQFKNQTIGLLVTFDSSGKIGGMHLVPAF